MKTKASASVRSIDVARMAGVSRSAVSRTFTEGAYVADTTRKKVMKAAAALGYRPNAIARSLITRRSRIVGVVVADLSNPFYPKVLEAICQKLQQEGLAPLLLSCRHAKDLDSLVPQMLAYQVDGVIIAAATLSSTLAAECARADKPVVLVNRYVNFDAVSAVYCDNAAGGLAVAKFLVGAGHKRIAFLAGLEDTSSSRDRERGFVNGLRRSKISLYARDVGDYDYRTAVRAVRRLLSLDPRPDAIFCANDTMAIAAIDVARSDFGLDVPRDVSVVGYDNIDAGAWQGYDLTTVDQNVDRMTSMAVDLLLKKRAKPDMPPQRLLVPAQLEIRRSARHGRNP